MFLAHFDPALMHFGPKCFEAGFVSKNGTRMRQMCGVHKQVRLAHFEPVLTQFNCVQHMYAPRCTLRMYLRDVHRGACGEENHFFQILFLDHLACPNKYFWPNLSPWWRGLGHGKCQNAWKMGRFGTKKRVKNGSKMHFSKSDPGPLGMLKPVFLANFEPLGTHFGAWKIPKRLEKGPFGT